MRICIARPRCIPIGFALSDLETYYRAGTFQTGLIKLMQTVSKAESDAKAGQDKNKPAPTADSQAKLDANKTEAKVKAETPPPAESRGCKQRRQCGLQSTRGCYHNFVPAPSCESSGKNSSANADKRRGRQGKLKSAPLTSSYFWLIG